MLGLGGKVPRQIVPLSRQDACRLIVNFLKLRRLNVNQKNTLTNKHQMSWK